MQQFPVSFFRPAFGIFIATKIFLSVSHPHVLNPEAALLWKIILSFATNQAFCQHRFVFQYPPCQFSRTLPRGHFPGLFLCRLANKSSKKSRTGQRQLKPGQHEIKPVQSSRRLQVSCAHARWLRTFSGSWNTGKLLYWMQHHFCLPSGTDLNRLFNTCPALRMELTQTRQTQWRTLANVFRRIFLSLSRPMMFLHRWSQRTTGIPGGKS